MNKLEFKYNNACKQECVNSLQDYRQMPEEQVQKMDDRGPGMPYMTWKVSARASLSEPFRVTYR